jgi:hypothetical protein
VPNVIRVRWTITPEITPQPWRPCSRCGEPRPFRCSGKFRLNASGKRLDAWLIYKCTDCDETWNRTVIERRTARDLESAMLAAFEANDPALVKRFAFDVAALRRSSHRVAEFGEVEVRKELLCGTRDASTATLLEISLVVPIQVSLRLDRLLATELRLSRSRIAALADAGRLRADAALGKAVRDGSRIEVVGLSTDEVNVAISDSALTGEKDTTSLS